MRIPVNLASEPFQRTRRVVVGTAAAAVLMLGSLALLIALSLMERGQTDQMLATISGLESRVAKLAQEEARLQGILRKPQNAVVLERSLFLNSLLYAKGISWTRLFDDLEAVMPHNVRLISIRPQVSANQVAGSGNEVLLEMEVGSESEAPVGQLLVKLENSARFGLTTLQNRVPPSQNEPLLRYRFTVVYRQALESPKPVAVTNGSQPAKGVL